jgi:formylglycine-generating enzyme required for sulfatase activity
MRQILLFTLLAFAYQTASAQSLLETFGSGANAFTMEFVTIGNPGNAPDTTGNPNPAGSVAYTYNLGKYEVSRDMITKANSAGSLGITLGDLTFYGGNGGNKPATAITWYEAAKFVNWLNTSTGGTAAYKFDGSGTFQLWSEWDAGYDANNLFRNSLAKYWLPSSNEWYKGAYGSPNGTWYDYTTGSNSAPTAVAGGTDPNTAVYGGQSGPADISNAGGLSAYGTMAQGGNVTEWNETAYDGSNNIAGENRDLRAGRFSSGNGSGASSRSNIAPTDEVAGFIGFRVASVPEASVPEASVPEPSALSLLAIGLGGLAILRRRK